MRARFQRTGQLAVDVQQPDVPIRHLARVNAVLAQTSKRAQGREFSGEFRVKRESRVQVEPVHARLHRSLPVELSLRRANDLADARVLVYDRHFAGTRLDQREQPIDVHALSLDQVVYEPVREHRLGQVETLYVVASAKPAKAVRTRFKETDEVSVLEQESAFVLQHDEFLNKEHGLPSSSLSNKCARSHNTVADRWCRRIGHTARGRRSLASIPSRGMKRSSDTSRAIRRIRQPPAR